MFKLDADFDVLIDNNYIHILRPAAFEFAGQLQQAVLEAVPKNIASLQKDLDFVDFSDIQTYAANHPRAARYLASIRTAQDTRNISYQNLKDICLRTGVEVFEKDGKLHVHNQHIMGFLEVLDRRRYELELINGKPEQFRAPSRQRIKE
ncbi:hypothetical protein JOC37_001820 [Desulfohalotomaculum tongense]|uniref:Kiwa anti-phage protein KwaB-like domain-containing protein n=1 Tax=Desulforadius tongensis TaxID=1216062 RepID=UPI00195E33AD|nr:hypothetical protein [Desulforadius tongensis]